MSYAHTVIVAVHRARGSRSWAGTAALLPLPPPPPHAAANANEDGEREHKCATAGHMQALLGGIRTPEAIHASSGPRYRRRRAATGGSGAWRPIRRRFAGMADGPSDEKHCIRMIADRLLVVPSKEAGERKSRAGILIPATADVSRRLVWAEVAAVGPTVRTVEAGDAVLFSPEIGLRGRDPGRRIPDPARARRARGRVAARARAARGSTCDRSGEPRCGSTARSRSITGATRGIGRAIAEACAAAGADIVVVARKPAELEETEAAIAALGARVVTVQGSVGDPDDRRAGRRPSRRRVRPARHRRQQRRDQSGVRPADGRRPRRGRQGVRRQHRAGRCVSCRAAWHALHERPRRRGAERRLGRRHARRAVHRRVQRVEGRAHPPHAPARAGARARRCA